MPTYTDGRTYRNKEASRVRRGYKTNVTRENHLLPGEKSHVTTMVVVLHIAGYSRMQTAKLLKISVGQVNRMMHSPDAQEQVVLLRAKLPQAAMLVLQDLMVEAVVAIADVMRTTKDDKLVITAAGEILDRAGLPKASRQERHTVSEEKTTITDDGLVEKLRTASPKVQEEAAQIIERLEQLLVTAAEEK